jgi:hypothetical protein
LISYFLKHEDFIVNDAVSSASNATNILAAHLCRDVSIAFQNQKELNSKTKALKVSLDVYSAQTREWLKLFNEFNTALKELGDIENWSEVVLEQVEEIIDSNI